MAINYQTGVASSPLDLLQKFRTFLLAHGWASTTPSGGDYVLNNPDGDLYVGFDATSTDLLFRGALGANAGLSYDNQPNNSGSTFTVNVGAGPYTAYHFFVGDEDGRDYAHAVVEISALHYRHMVFGQLIKAGTYDGGVYCDATRFDLSSGLINAPTAVHHTVICDTIQSVSQAGHIRVDYDGKVNNWCRLRDSAANPGGDTNAALGSVRTNGIDEPLFAAGVQQWNLRTPMWPLNYFVQRPSSLRSPVGRIPHMRYMTIRNFTPGETITIGGEQWMVFPFHRRQVDAVAANVASSGVYAYAYRLS